MTNTDIHVNRYTDLLMMNNASSYSLTYSLKTYMLRKMKQRNIQDENVGRFIYLNMRQYFCCRYIHSHFYLIHLLIFVYFEH